MKKDKKIAVYCRNNYKKAPEGTTETTGANAGA